MANRSLACLKSLKNKTSIGLYDLLLVLFIGLKISNVIAWSWWWVMAPLWLPLAIILACAFMEWLLTPT